MSNGNAPARRIACVKFMDGYVITVPKGYGVDTGYSGWSEFRPYHETLEPSGHHTQTGWTAEAQAGYVLLRPPAGVAKGAEIEVPRSKCQILWVPVEAPKEQKR
jgi:hypothetical protein